MPEGEIVGKSRFAVLVPEDYGERHCWYCQRKINAGEVLQTFDSEEIEWKHWHKPCWGIDDD